MVELHPPFLPKTVTRYRHEYFLAIKRQFLSNLDSKKGADLQQSLAYLKAFVSYFDC